MTTYQLLRQNADISHNFLWIKLVGINSNFIYIYKISIFYCSTASKVDQLENDILDQTSEKVWETLWTVQKSETEFDQSFEREDIGDHWLVKRDSCTSLKIKSLFEKVFQWTEKEETEEAKDEKVVLHWSENEKEENWSEMEFDHSEGKVVTENQKSDTSLNTKAVLPEKELSWSEREIVSHWSKRERVLHCSEREKVLHCSDREESGDNK